MRTTRGSRGMGNGGSPIESLMNLWGSRHGYQWGLIRICKEDGRQITNQGIMGGKKDGLICGGELPKKRNTLGKIGTRVGEKLKLSKNKSK